VSDTFISGVDSTTATFDVIYQEGRSIKGAGAISVRPLPYGGGAVIQSAGRAPVTRTFKLFIASQTELDNLLHCRGDHGTLSIFEGSYDCTLESVDAAEWWPNGNQEAVAVWIMDVL